MLQQVLDRVINSLKNFVNRSRSLPFVDLVVKHLFLAFLLYTPLCMQARAETFIQDAKSLKDAQDTSRPTTSDATHSSDVDVEPQGDIVWLGQHTATRSSLKTLEAGWKEHVKSCQSKWIRALKYSTLFPSIALLVQVLPITQSRDRALALVPVVRIAAAVFHLAGFHVLVFPRVKDVNLLLRCVPDIDNLMSPLWVSMALPLASVLWSSVFALMTIHLIVNSNDAALTGGAGNNFLLYFNVALIVPDLLSVGWISYQIRRL